MKRAPRGFDPEHPLIEDLKRKDYVVSRPLDEDTVCAEDFADRFVALCESAAPLTAYVCRVLGLAW